MTACDTCLRRSWLLGRLGAHIERTGGRRRRPADILSLGDGELIAAIGGTEADAIRAAWKSVDAGALRAGVARAGLDAVCVHDDHYPARLLVGPGAPALLHVAGRRGAMSALLGSPGRPLPPAAAIVGARRATADGLEVARALGRGLAAAGITVISGMALGIDAAAHAGALEAGGRTVAVLAGGADAPYPAAKRGLYEDIVARGCAVSEMPPGFRPFKWTFPARNRTIAALAQVTIVVEAAERSGSLITADFAAALGRDVAAVPGRVTAPHARGTNALIIDGATLVRDARDVLDLLFGVGAGPGPRGGPAGLVPAVDAAAGLESRLRVLLADVEDGRDSVAALSSTAEEARAVTVALAELEMLGLVRRRPGGRYGRVLA
jgi:DNA processing protein